MNDIKNIIDTSTFKKIEYIDKGWSKDKKYHIETTDGQHLLLRISDISELDNKDAEFGMMEKVSALGIPMSKPLEFGVSDDKKHVYILLSWCDGDDAESILPSFSEETQYLLGIKSGRILKMLHTIPGPEKQEDWAVRFNKKINQKISKYQKCGLYFNGDEKIIEYIENNRGLLENRPQCYQHGDYHIGNMIVSSESELSIIDFNRPDYGDPWEEFNRIVWSAGVSPYFATGQIKGYFEGEPPLEFFKLLRFYIFNNTLSSISWAIPFGQAEVDTMLKQSQDVLAWFDSMRNPVPSWYIEKYIDISIVDDIGGKIY